MPTSYDVQDCLCLSPHLACNTQQMMAPINSSVDKLLETVRDREAWHAAVHGGPKELDTT